MIRATTIGLMKSYRNNLNNSYSKLGSAQKTMLTQRLFNSYAEDPAAASRAFQLRRSRMAAENQYTINDATHRKYQTGFKALISVVNDVDNETQNSVKDAMDRALSDPTGDARAALGKELNELADTLVQTMNSKYGDSFIFSGADGQTVPFTWGDNGELLYRGVPVDAAVPQVDTDAAGGKFTLPLAADGTYDPVNGSDHYFITGKSELVEFDPADPDAEVPENALLDDNGDPVTFDEDGNPDPTGTYYLTMDECAVISKEDYEQAEENVAKLDYMSKEAYYVDIGLGFKENASDELIKSSAFNAALQGINFLGYGVDEDGDPKNIVTLIKQAANICITGDGMLSKGEYNELFRLVGKTEDASDRLHNAHTQMDAATGKLKNNAQLLEDNLDNLEEQCAALEDVDMADAISAFLWAQYSYNAALRVGNSILSQSLMDYMQ